MLTSVRSTSKAAYTAIADEGLLNAQQLKIINQMKARLREDFSLQELCVLTGMQINAVSGRCYELKHMQPRPVLVEAEKRKCSITGRTIHPLRLASSEPEQQLLFAA